MNNAENQNPGTNKSKDEGEIDVVPVLKAIGTGISSFFTRIFNFIFQTLSFLFSTVSSLFINTVLLFRRFFFAIARHKALFTILILSGAVAGFFVHQYFRPYYKGSIVVASQGLKGLYFTEVITNLDDLAEEENYKELARKLNITPLVSKNIKGIEIEPLQFSAIQDEWMSEITILGKTIESLDKLDKSDTLILEKKIALQEKVDRLKIQLEMNEKPIRTNENEFKIDFYVYDSKIFPVLKESIMEYLADNSFGKKRVELKIQDLEKQKTITKEQITKLDSLKKIIDKSYTEFYTYKQEDLGSNNIVLGGQAQSVVTPPDPFRVYQQEFQLQEKQLEIEKDLFLLQNLEIIHDLTIFQAPSSFKKSHTTGIGALAGFALFLCFLGLKNVKYLNVYLDEMESRQAERRKKSQIPSVS